METVIVTTESAIEKIMERVVAFPQRNATQQMN